MILVIYQLSHLETEQKPETLKFKLALFYVKNYQVFYKPFILTRKQVLQSDELSHAHARSQQSVLSSMQHL